MDTNAIRQGCNSVFNQVKYDPMTRGFALSIGIIGATASIATLTSASASLVLVLGALILFSANAYNLYALPNNQRISVLVKAGEFEEAKRLVEVGLFTFHKAEICESLCHYLVEHPEEPAPACLNRAFELLNFIFPHENDLPLRKGACGKAIAEALVFVCKSDKPFPKSLHALYKKLCSDDEMAKEYQNTLWFSACETSFHGCNKESIDQSRRYLEKICTLFHEEWGFPLTQETFEAIFSNERLCSSPHRTRAIISTLRAAYPELHLDSHKAIQGLFNPAKPLDNVSGDLEASYTFLNEYIEQITQGSDYSDEAFGERITKLFIAINSARINPEDFSILPQESVLNYWDKKAQLLIAVFKKSPNNEMAFMLIDFAVREGMIKKRVSKEECAEKIFHSVLAAVAQVYPKAFQKPNQPFLNRLLQIEAEPLFFEMAIRAKIDLRKEEVLQEITKRKEELDKRFEIVRGDIAADGTNAASGEELRVLEDLQAWYASITQSICDKST
jgi:hypothetical protein